MKQIVLSAITDDGYHRWRSPPMMADLPIERFSFQNPPFMMTDIDYFCRFLVTGCRSTEQQRRLLFTCLMERFIHPESAPLVKPNSCVKGIQRFIAQRRTPFIMWLEYGKKFVGVEIDLPESIRKWSKRAPELFVHTNIIWKLNPPGAPHQVDPKKNN